MKLNKILNTTILIAVLLIGINTHSQEGNTINITTTGTGLTKNNAINDALRNALEQTYGGFISSKTNITNDELFNDEVKMMWDREINIITYLEDIFGRFANAGVNNMYEYQIDEGMNSAHNESTFSVEYVLKYISRQEDCCGDAFRNGTAPFSNSLGAIPSSLKLVERSMVFFQCIFLCL